MVQVHILNALFQDNKTEPQSSGPVPVHVAYSPLASMNHQWTINLHDWYRPPCALIPGDSTPTFIPTLYNLWYGCLLWY